MVDPDLAADAELLAEITAVRRELIDLARVASMASIVEPSLLRLLRRRLIPGLDVGIEADLWFSPLTHVASATAWTMRTGIATLLRDQLRTGNYSREAYADQDVAATARDIVLEAHAGHSDMLQLEDTIIFQTVVGNDHGVEQAFQRVLATLDAAPELAVDVVRWFGQAQRRVPPSTLTSTSAARLSAVAALHLDGVVPDSILAADHFPEGVGTGAPTTLPRTEVAVALDGDGLRFSPADAADGAVIRVPLTRPLVVEARWTTPAGEVLTRVVRAQPGDAAPLPQLRGEVELRTLAGTRFRLTRVAPALTVDYALDMLQSLALAFHMRRFFAGEARDERIEREILSLSDEQGWARYQHVRVMGEYFTEPVRRFLDGGDNPLSVPSDLDLGSQAAEVTQSAASAPATSQLASYPGIDGTGLSWPSFRDYIDWLTGSMRGYIAAIVERLGPRLVSVGYAVTEEVWQAARAIAGPEALPAEGRSPMGRRRPDEPEKLVYNVERAAVPALIDALVPPILDAIAQAETERPPPALFDHPDLAEAPAESDRRGAAAFEAGDLGEARAQYEQSLVLYERTGNQSGIASAHRQLSKVALRMVDLDAAEQHQTIALEIDRRSGGPAVAEGEYQLSLIARARGDLDTAELKPVFFISYRREESGWAAKSLREGLENHFGEAIVFMDSASIHAGQDWPERLREAIASCNVMLVLIGPYWLDVRNPSGVRRIDDPSDWVRREVEDALQRPSLIVVPVLLDGAHVPSVDQLPGSLADLPTRNAVSLTAGDWEAGINELIEELRREYFGGREALRRRRRRGRAR